ncbi:HAMP domain-containing histidine kinase [Trichocoleus sp. DQ-A3]|uniref:two-component system sensor histidine kinase RppB n=1 Tax=Cyanophyceae TaxID=3028117 RepID=UPI0016826B38|nr:two-component sensor histidine kinase [Coleofasciculus sp. FACHB-125]
MNENKLFQLTRWRLAGWYAGVMGVILSLCGVAVYEAIARANWVALDRELESVAGTLHDSIEPILQQPGRLEPAIQQLLPDICLLGEKCVSQIENPTRHTLGAIHQGDYYVRLLENSGRPVALAGLQPVGLLAADKGDRVSTPQLWQILQNRQGTRFHQISLSLHTKDNRPWGYLQVGRSLKELDDHLTALKFILLLGLPVAMIVVAGSSWWLAGLAMQPIYQSYGQIQQFTADAAHELRTPLAAIQATVESTLRMNQLSELEARDTLKTIERQNYRLSELVRDLLLLSRMDRQALSIKYRPACLNDLVSDVAEELSALAIAADLTLSIDIRTPEPLHVNGDEEQLYRLIFNLVVNAIQYTPAGGQVAVILDSSTQALIYIKDTGVGIALPEQTRIFDRFYRVNSDRSRHTGGSGLGLSIAKAIAIAHNGSIEVQSELSKGSTFTIRLPLHN